jgi:hypothetical protein
MPLREIKQSTGFIRIKTEGKVTVSSSLIPKFFNGKRFVKIFHDEEKKLIGFEPSDTGYKLMFYNRHYSLTCHFLSRIVQGEFYPSWSKKHNMLVFSYEAKLGN